MIIIGRMIGMPDFQIEKAESPNFTKGRRGRKIAAIVNHITAGLMPGTLTWMQNPAAKASAHFLVTKKGRIYQLVEEEDTAFGAGIVNKPDWPLYDGTNPNFYTLNIEHEAMAGETLTDIQYQATLWLHRYLTAKWGIPVDNDHIIGHYRLDSINRKNDPGPNFPWDKLISDLKTGQNPNPRIVVGDKQIAGIIIENKTYAAVRELSEALELNVLWDEKGRNVFIYPSGSEPEESTAEISVFIISKVTKGIIIQDRTYVPVRETAESLGRTAIWHNDTKTVIIS